MCWLRKWGFLISSNANFEFVVIVLIFANIVSVKVNEWMDCSLGSRCLCFSDPQRRSRHGFTRLRSFPPALPFP